MAEDVKKNVKFITSFALACPDKDEEIRHFQLTIVQVTDTGEFGCYFDVVDPSKIKLQEPEQDELS